MALDDPLDDARARRRARVRELLGDLFDLADPSERARTIGEQADRRRRRDRFVAVGVDIAREIRRAAIEVARAPGRTR
jgi:hypothetical protein